MLFKHADTEQHRASQAADNAAPSNSGLAGWLQRYSLPVFIALVAIGSWRIAGTYLVFSHTYDEPAHIAAGMEWLAKGQYQYEPLHPPLARVAAAAGPFVDGGTSHGETGMWHEGLAILGSGEHYDRTLMLARLGILPFFWLACLVVYLWGRSYFSEAVAVIAVLIFSMLPPVLAHAGLATTDMALTATVGAAFLAAMRWCEQPALGRTLVLGLATGLAALSKFSALAFLPAAFAATLLLHWLRQRPRPAELLTQARTRSGPLALAIGVALLTVWAGYRFSYGPVPFTAWRLPFPELFSGIHDLVAHNRLGANFAYLLGQHNPTGWWYYYFVVLAVKTPLAALALLGLGLVLGVRSALSHGVGLALAFSGGILLFCLSSRINLGVRHILPVYIGFSLIAATAAVALFERGRRWRPAQWIAAALLLGLVESSALAHPDYLAYFNALAGSHPERILVDSDLDWGQDLKRLAQRMRELGVQELAFTPCISLDPAAVGLPPLTANDFLHPSPGWNAVRLTPLELMLADQRVQHPQLRFWPDVIKPAEKIGKTILLWQFPAGSLPPAPPGLPTARVQCS